MGLTMLRLLLLPVFLYLLLLDAGPDEPGRVNPHRWWALGVFAVMALTDKLDGYLARRLNQTSRLGTLLDPIADKLLVASSLILLSSKWIAAPGFHIPLYVVAAVYGKDVIVAVGTIYLLYTVGSAAIRPRLLGKVGTFLQLVLVILILVAPDVHRMAPTQTLQSLRLLEALVAAVAVASLVDYTVQGVRSGLEARRLRALSTEKSSFPGPESLN
jgi:CDP-diacylglycerol--glycerol-3-phosphate 3-phosphatidyltransferase